MSFGYPIMALANPVPNQTFSIPATAASEAAGWTVAGAHGSAEVFESTDRLGHERGQRYTLSAGLGFTVTSAPSRPYQLCANMASTLFTVFALLKVSGIAGASSGTVTFQIKFYNSSDTLLQTSTLKLLSLVGDNTASWVVIQNTASINVPANVQHFRLSISVDRSTTAVPVVLDLRFLGVGTWTTSAGYLDWSTITPSIQPDLGVESYKTSGLSIDEDTYGQPTFLDRDRYVQPNTLEMPVSNLPNELKIQLEYGFRMNRGRGAGVSTVNPGGGFWDLIVVPNQPTCVYLMLCRFDGDTFPLRLDRSLEWMPEPPIWAGLLRFRERV